MEHMWREGSKANLDQRRQSETTQSQGLVLLYIIEVISFSYLVDFVVFFIWFSMFILMTKLFVSSLIMCD